MIGIPLVALISNVIFYYDMNEQHGFSFWKDYLYTLVITWLLWEAARQVIIYTRKKFGAFHDSKRRILLTALGTVGITVLIMTGISLFYDLTNWWGYDYTVKNYLYNNFAALTYCTIVGGIYEGIYYFGQWRMVTVEAERLKKENLQSQFDSLKQQMSPHFLFNSLNTLSSLMRKDVDRAELFLDELSRVYRYLLRNTEDQLIDLASELQFIQSYFHLLRTRYVDSIILQIDVDEDYESYFIPPLTLQLLVENAVKHNVVDKSRLLKITIQSTEQASLLVSNNLQKKVNRFPSNKIGLANIDSRYRLLGYKGVAIVETETAFMVEIPLLKNGIK